MCDPLVPGPAPQAFTPGEQPGRLYLPQEKEVRHCTPALRHALGHAGPDGPERQLLTCAETGRRGIRNRAVSAECLDVGRDHGSVRAAACHLREFDPMLLREPPRLGGGELPACGPTLCRRDRLWLDARHRLRVPAGRCRCTDRSRLGHGLSRPHDHSDGLPDADLIALGGSKRERAVGGRLHLDRDLVGLDLHERLALGHRLAVHLQPAEDLARLLRHPQGRHDHVGGHLRIDRRSLEARGSHDLFDATVSLNAI